MVEGDTPPVSATAASIRKRYNHGKARNAVRLRLRLRVGLG